MHTYLLSDLHLTPERPAISQAFMQFLAGPASSAERIYLLGDLFEYWIGDDAAALIGAQPILDAMKAVSQTTECYFIAGNRDFLVGEQFTQASGFKILPDETVVNLYGRQTLLLHGDSLCSDDIAHQQFRQLIVTNEEWKAQFLNLAIPDRIEQAKKARMQSNEHKSNISMEIMDVSEQSVLDTFAKYQVNQMIHGHTHRQATHDYTGDNGDLQRYVLGDWGETSSIMTVNQAGISIDNTALS